MTTRTETHRCRECGSNETRADSGVGGGRACVGCGCGVTSPAYGLITYPTCTRCGGHKSYDMFKGAYCIKCNDWC